MFLLSDPSRVLPTILVISMFCVTNVSMLSIVRHNKSSDNFMSGGYPNTGAADHAWEITVNQSHQILLQFLDFSLNETTSCTVDVLQVFDGNRSSNMMVDRFCWDNVTNLTSAAYISSGNQFFIRLMTNGSYTRKGFKVQYTTVALQHTNSSGEITSPGYPNTGKSVDEAWRIKVEVDHHIRLEIIDFALHETDPCDSDYFELYDGSCNPYNLRGRWCFDALEDFMNELVYMSTCNIFYLRLRTRHGHTRDGFKASYNSFPSNETDVSTPLCRSATSPPPLTTKVPTVTSIINITNVTTKTSLVNGSPSSMIPSTKIDTHSPGSTDPIFTTSKLDGTPPSTAAMTPPLTNSIIYIIPAIVLLIACILVGFCCCHFKHKQRKKQDSEALPSTEIQELKTSSHIKNEYLEESSSNKTDINSKSDVPHKDEDTNSSEDKESIPKYAIPHAKNSDVEEVNRNKVSENLKVEANDISSKRKSGDLKTTETNQIVSPETKHASDQARAKNTYSYVDRDAHSKEEDKTNDVLYSVPNKKKTNGPELVPNEGYESYDETQKESKRDIVVDDIPYSLIHDKERESEGMVINEAYESYGSGENRSNTDDNATYYYVDKNDKKEIEEPKELFYEPL